MNAAGALNGLPRALRKRVWPHAHESHKANATAQFALGANAMLDMTAGAKPTPATITTRHLANELAEQHQLSKKQGLEMMEELDHQAFEKGRASEDRRARNSASAETRRPYGPQSGDRPANPHQGEQKGCLSRHQGTQDGDLIARCPPRIVR